MKKPTIFFVLSGKGGCGKTFFSANLSSVFSYIGVEHLLYSLEVHGHQLKYYHPNAIELVMDEVAINRADNTLDRIFYSAQDTRNCVLIDCGANIGRGLASWMIGVDFFRLCVESQIRVAIVIVAVSGDGDTSLFFEQSLELAGSQVDWYLVRSRYTGDDFAGFDGLAKKSGAVVIDMPIVPLHLLQLSRQYAKTFPALAQSSEIDVMRRARCLRVAREFTAAVNPLLEGVEVAK
jgi:hypothetical protein